MFTTSMQPGHESLRENTERFQSKNFLHLQTKRNSDAS